VTVPNAPDEPRGPQPDRPEGATADGPEHARRGPVTDGPDGPVESELETGPEAAERAEAAAAEPETDIDVDANGEDLNAAADAVESDIAQLAAARDEYLDAYRRVQADFENYRKQTQKRLEANVAAQLGGFIERLLPVLDACDAASSQGNAEAVDPILTALYSALEKEGLERLSLEGEPFDPEVAEAVQHMPGEGGEQVVAEVMRSGYRWKGRLLRPALVKVTD
jgi:molecular chaperone GrpE